MAKKSETIVKRIPAGIRVTWKARYDSDPVNEGVVQAFVKSGEVFPGGKSWDKNCGPDLYLVLRDRTPSGKPKAVPNLMRPLASRLEAQNPDALK